MVVVAGVLPYLLVLIAFALRIYRIETQSLWWDEGISLDLATSCISSILSDRASDVHPPLYFLLLRRSARRWPIATVCWSHLIHRRASIKSK